LLAVLRAAVWVALLVAESVGPWVESWAAASVVT
jgi:hypothetical protein